MALEIERKFLLRQLPPLDGSRSRELIQGYLRTDAEASVRVRIAGDRAWLTVKGAARGITRDEFEYPVPVKDAEQMLELTMGHVIRKRRHVLDVAGREWEIDVFTAPNDGLIIAEVELPSEDTALELPSWVGREISEDARYLNSNLARRPYGEWPDSEKS